VVPRFTPGEVAAEFDIIFQGLYGDGKEPYGKKGWRDLGVTTRMCSVFCERKDIGLRVLYKNHVIYRNTLEGDKDKQVIVYHIHSNHAFFYDNPTVKQAASRLRPGPAHVSPQKPVVRLRTRGDTTDSFDEMREFSWGAFQEAVANDTPMIFRCYPHEIAAVKKQAEANGIPVWASLGNRPHLIRSVNVCTQTKERPKIRVKAVPVNAEQLREFCRKFEELCQVRLDYGGESQSVVFMRALTALCINKRVALPSETKERLRRAQGDRCGMCGDKLTQCELHHRTPVCMGGDNSDGNLQALCPMCHASETERLLLSGLDQDRLHTIESHLSPKVWRELHCGPKPKEVSFGVSHNLEHCDIKDLLNKHPNPERMGSQKKQKGTVLCLDAVGCRVNALAKRERGLPVFCPLDEPEPYISTEEWDFVYIDMECRVHQGLFPYTGSRWYAAELADYLLERQIMTEQCCKAGLRATRHIPSSELARHIDTLAVISGDKAFHKQGIALECHQPVCLQKDQVRVPD
jgi:hypothetical protein